MSKKKNNQVDEIETPETDVENTENDVETTDTVKTTEDVVTNVGSTEDDMETTDVETTPPVTEGPDTNFNYVGNNMANEETYSKAHLYNRNDYPVTITLTDGSQLVLSPRQKTEPIGVILFNQEEIAAVGVLKIDI